MSSTSFFSYGLRHLSIELLVLAIETKQVHLCGLVVSGSPCFGKETRSRFWDPEIDLWKSQKPSK